MLWWLTYNYESLEVQFFSWNLHANAYLCVKNNNGFAWIFAQPLLEPLLNMHTASYMSVMHYRKEYPKGGHYHAIILPSPLLVKIIS